MNEGIVDRVRKIIDHYGISVSAFANALGVQRSSVSHILSGRNNPSLDFVMKLMQAYPEVNLYWLLNGLGNFLKDDNIPIAPTPEKSKNTVDNPSLSDVGDEILTPNNHRPTQIVIFYSDGSFASFNPKKSKDL
ncbi:helix-turn-helix domain-containing protein [Flagellimonas flava]|uniref:Helix-turn-helix n=1 Tax=Flagellimonas flava TaxID=570519 RepID=A0A1M5IY98_9FLAO|nr:helix-turn-helix transcriptional regulator [Allomuricauda flava]SHG32940.1 Helix-turn-helix [Allomuricauda flava]